MSKNKIFVGSGKVQTDTWFKCTINPDKLLDEYIQEYNGNRYIKLNINVKDQPDKYGKDVEITIDTWQPKKSKVTEDDVNVYDEQPRGDSDNDDLPF